MTLESYDYAGLNDLFRSGMITEDAYYTELMHRNQDWRSMPCSCGKTPRPGARLPVSIFGQPPMRRCRT